MTTQPPTTDRVTLNGLSMYLEQRGEGRPFVLLHGAILVDLAPLVDRLANKRRVISPHLQGRGHTPDIDRPFSYEAMADDVAALLDHLGLASADIGGQSMGAGVALRLALRHPSRVDRLVLVSTAMSSDGWHPTVQAELADMETKAAEFAAQVARSDIAKAYPEVDWETLFRKTGQFQQQPYDLHVELAALPRDTLLAFADEDAVTPRHMLAFWSALGGGRGEAGLNGSRRTPAQLAVIPGTNHASILQSALLARAIDEFLVRGRR